MGFYQKKKKRWHMREREREIIWTQPIVKHSNKPNTSSISKTLHMHSNVRRIKESNVPLVEYCAIECDSNLLDI